MPLRIRFTIEQVIEGDEKSTLEDVRKAILPQDKETNVSSTMIMTINGMSIAADKPFIDHLPSRHSSLSRLDLYHTADGLSQLKLQDETGHARDVLVSHSQTIKAHKTKIEQVHDVPIANQKLMLDNRELSNDCKLPDVVFTEGRTLELRTRVTADIDIDLHTTTGRVIPIATPTTTYVADFKKQIQETEGIEPECLRLYFRGQKLHDDNVLGYYGIKDWTVISLFVVTTGSSRTPSKAGIMG